MPQPDRIFVDANILCSVLLRPDSPFTRRIVQDEKTFIVYESAIVSLFKYKASSRTRSASLR